ncbi:MAG: hypothetical protein HDQ91_06480 [Desulfovibrio sp.]|nr:hypothetical protein [Desulfovibrio sp.]
MRFILLCLTIFCVAGCFSSERPKKTEIEIPRAAPGYLHWLQKQSMLGEAPSLIAQVSQTQRVWLQPGEPRRANVLLNAAPNWLELAELPANPKSPYFRELAAQVATARKMGFGGIYLGATGESPDVWTEKNGMQSSRAPASFNFDASFGTDEDFRKLAQAAEENGLELGSDLLSGATGRGPDFFLQARNAPEHGGLYAMLPVPEKAEALLPLTHEEWDCEALSAQAIDELAQAGVLPASIARDRLVWTSKGGWAATGAVMGVDGVPRRWIYRFAEDPGQPVLSWQDPSGSSAKVLHAAAIRQTGLLGEALAGLHFEPLMALEPDAGGTPSLSPGISALNDLARQIHRYGGWALQADPLPLSAMLAVLQGPCDFCRDDLTPLLVAYGLVMADGRPVAQLYRDWLSQGLDVSRLARGFNSHKGYKPALLLNNPAWTEAAQKLASLGQTIDFRLLFRQIFPSGNNEAEIEQIRRFLLCWRLGMPGLAFVEFYPGSLSRPSDGWLEHTLATRARAGLATGKIAEVIRGRGGGFGLLTRLPSGGFWLLACNFGKNPDELVVRLPENIRSAMDAGTAQSLDSGFSGTGFRLGLSGKDSKNVFFEASSVKP